MLEALLIEKAKMFSLDISCYEQKFPDVELKSMRSYTSTFKFINQYTLVITHFL